ncbi:MAG: molybdopterin-synthase adenylyltransferase MoeB [Acidimicrobiia bacterium]|nr:molybdopterin-synthase adenylyltransferase MoeB [Acidimicrobiia bacterium]
METYQQKLAAARERVEEVTPEALNVAAGLILDVRTSDETALGLIPNAVTLPMDRVKAEIRSLDVQPGDRIVLYCAVGERSLLAAAELLDAGYTNVASLAGGMKRWMSLGLPTTSPSGLSDLSRRRYARHIVMPQVGIAGQQTLIDARVVIIGAGGLGSPAALYLAAAGVGTIGLVDHDVVELSNLQRQILHGTADIGMAKVTSGAQRIREIDSSVSIQPHDTMLDSSNALGILGSYDLAIDATDNFATRYLINDASIHVGVPVVHGSVFRFEGQLAVFKPHETACYRCVFPDPPPGDLAPNCTEAGVFGVLPGVVGTMQATEALKLLLGIGEPLLGRLLTYDALSQTIHTVRLKRRPDCVACSGPPPPLRDHPEYC